MKIIIILILIIIKNIYDNSVYGMWKSNEEKWRMNATRVRANSETPPSTEDAR